MFKQIKEFFFGKPVEIAKKEETKVEAVNAVPYKAEAPVTVEVAPALAPVVDSTPVKKAPAKKRTFVKRDEGGVAKVAPVKAKPKAPAKPRTPKAK